MSSRRGSQHQITGNLDGAWLRAAQDPHSLPFQRLAAVDALSRHYARGGRFWAATFAVVVLAAGTFLALAPESQPMVRIGAGLLALASAAGGALIAREGGTIARALQGWLAVGHERTIPLGSVLRGLGKARLAGAIVLIVAALTWVALLAVGVVPFAKGGVGAAAAIVLPIEAVTVAVIIGLGLRRLTQGAKGVLPPQQRGSTRPAQDHTFSPQVRHAPTGPVISVTDPVGFGAHGYSGGDGDSGAFGAGSFDRGNPGQGYSEQGQSGLGYSDQGYPAQASVQKGPPPSGFPQQDPPQQGFGGNTPPAAPVVAAVPWSAAPAPLPAPTVEPFVAVPAFGAAVIGSTDVDEAVDQTIARPSIRATGTRVLVSDARGVHRELGQGQYLLGRAPVARQAEEGVDLVVLDDRGVSKTHLAVEIIGGVVYVTDRASTNGTTLRGAAGSRQLSAWERVELGPHDQAIVGSTVLMRAE